MKENIRNSSYLQLITEHIKMAIFVAYSVAYLLLYVLCQMCPSCTYMKENASDQSRRYCSKSRTVAEISYSD